MYSPLSYAFAQVTFNLLGIRSHLEWNIIFLDAWLVLPSFQTIGCFGFSKYIIYTMYLDTMYI
jgi:hypothetical protein